MAPRPAAVPIAANPATPAPAPVTNGTAAPGTATQPASAPPGADMFWVLIPVLVGMILLSTFSARKQKKQKAKLLAELKKHDRVMTTSGMIGFVAEVKSDVVVLKVEEGRDVRLTFTRDAIATILKSAPADAAAADND